MKVARGFTLLELMITVALVAILAALAAPSFTTLIQRSRLTAGTNELVAALQLARMEAIRTNSRVELCPTTSGTSCSGSDWRRVAVLKVRGGASTPLRDVQMNGGNLTVLASSNVTAASPNKIWFLPDGFVRTGSSTAPTQKASLGICTTKLSTENARDIQIDVSRIRVKPDTRTTCAAPSN